MSRVLIATSNPGKLRDFRAAAAPYGIEITPVPDFSGLPSVVEDGATFEENARKKADHYSRFASGEMVLADDSGLMVDALGGAPGVHSARYAAGTGEPNSSDAANNARLLHETETIPDDRRSARFVCVIAAARDGRSLATVRGEALGQLLREPRGSGGFGYDPLFYFPSLDKTFAELSPEEKATVSHRGEAFRKFLDWCLAADHWPRTTT
ncbi:MAG: RdgB/HAM1 family non-canonical purine NTP pyrophosphatase [Terriglobales bacterium]